MKRFLVLLFGLLGCAILGSAQQLKSVSPKKPIVCYFEPTDKNTYVGPPAAFLEARANPNARTATADIQVQYVGFDSQSRDAFQFAVDIWKTLIQSPVKIKIKAFWRPLAKNVLGQANWTNAYANFPNAQKLNVYYPVALAEKIAGKDLNHPDSVDIFANFSSNIDWYYGTSGSPPNGATDLVSVVLHEIGHGLGFTDSYDVSGTQGAYGINGSEIPMIYDLGVENASVQNLFQVFDSPSAEMKTQLTSDKIFHNSPLATTQNGGLKPKLYAPTTWSSGSSIAHLDEATYSSGNINSLMSPQIGATEVIHNPGPIVLNMFTDMGWKNVRAEHLPANREDVSGVTLKVKITSDEGYDPAKVKLTYQKKNGGSEITAVGIPTGTPNEFKWDISNSGPDTLFYFFSASDNQNRDYTFPGKFVRAKNTELQGRLAIGLGTDTKAPVITHVPKTFITATATSLKLDAVITDNIGIQDVFVDYSINNVAQTAIALTQIGNVSYSNNSLVATYASAYTATLNFSVGQIKDGDVITYRIRAKDNSLAMNVGYSPSAATTHTVNVLGLLATQDSYQSNFDNLSGVDFFGDTQFGISTPSGFTNGAIHSVHPYPEAGTGSLNFVYQLRIPIKVKAQNATVKFDEIVLVEPGETGAPFGTVDFYDYVVVEGSKNGGTTWTPIADGYDSRDYAPWLTKYNSAIVNNISQGVGDPSLFKTRTLNLLNKFSVDDEVVIRFRLFSDPGAAGWGWAIDNLKIQIDDAPPTVLHNHYNFSTDQSKPLAIDMKVTDGSGVKSLVVEYKVNSGAVSNSAIPISANVSDYTLNLDIAQASVGDDVQYRIRAVDILDNEVVVPATDFIHVPIITIASPVAQYFTDFNTANTDFVGNFYSVSTPSGFSNGTLNSSHPYPNGFGLTNSNSAYTMMLKKPITISSTNPIMLFDEIAVIEPLNDYAVVDGSKDNGITWKPLVSEYSATSQSAWSIAYSSKLSGAPGMYKSRFINLTENGNFKAGDQILIRFRLNANSTINSWGWAIDNLSIQGPITGVEKTVLANSLSIYPNPSNGNVIKVELTSESGLPVRLQVLNSQGQSIQSDEMTPVDKLVRQEYNANGWVNGVYLLKAEVNGVVVTKKFIKSD